MLRAVVLEHPPDLRRAADHQQVAHEDDDPDERLDEVLDEGVAAVDHGVGGALGHEQRQQHEQAEREHDGDDERERDRATAHRHALAGRRQRARAHQPAGADDERLVEHHDAPEERRAREPVAVQDAVERLLGAEDLAVGPAHGDADGVAAAHQDALHERLAAVSEARHGQAVPGR